jgi:hypothetical protein
LVLVMAIGKRQHALPAARAKGAFVTSRNPIRLFRQLP